MCPKKSNLKRLKGLQLIFSRLQFKKCYLRQLPLGKKMLIHFNKMLALTMQNGEEKVYKTEGKARSNS